MANEKAIEKMFKILDDSADQIIEVFTNDYLINDIEEVGELMHDLGGLLTEKLNERLLKIIEESAKQ